jgi:xanthosine utilization system XapX-like protein
LGRPAGADARGPDRMARMNRLNLVARVRRGNMQHRFAVRLREHEQVARVIVAELQSANWPVPSSQLALIAQLHAVINQLEGAAKQLDGSPYESPSLIGCLGVAVVLGAIATAVVVPSPQMAPFAVALITACGLLLGEPIEAVHRHRLMAATSQAARADNATADTRLVHLDATIRETFAALRSAATRDAARVESHIDSALAAIAPVIGDARHRLASFE